ncbi:hypothetical protein BHE74_00041902 [Ensete ventricosum]|nr:hypothetical protein BHE74_00041902 [Ensete ventricosum]RZS23419.1 hypothetical protein BHM03_00056351 [Ensete ventricosum]
MSSSWVGSPPDLVAVRVLRSASWRMSSSWERRRLTSSLPPPPSPPFRLSKPSRIPFPSLETISK